MGSTKHFGLRKLGPGEHFSGDSYKYVDRDRDVIDQKLWEAITHRHIGNAGSLSNPGIGPTLTLTTTGGSLPAATRIYYTFTWVDPYGNETLAAPDAFVETPSQVEAPSPPGITSTGAGGSLTAGSYYYAVTAYVNNATQETTPSQPIFTTILSGTTNKITLDLPTLPTGATGFNIYRRKPGSSRFVYLDSVNMIQATPPTDYVDDGSASEDVNREAPSRNNTNAQNRVRVAVPAGVSIPTNCTWKIYRTYVGGSYQNSVLHHVVETSGGSVVTFFDDLGIPTTVGEPPKETQTVINPEKIDLNNAVEVQNKLPGSNVAGFPTSIKLSDPGVVTVGYLAECWECNWNNAKILGARAVMKNGSHPATQSIKVDVRVNGSSILGGGTLTIPAWQRVSQRFSGSGSVIASLANGDIVEAYVTQDGGGATPIATGLNVIIDLAITPQNATTSTAAALYD